MRRERPTRRRLLAIGAIVALAGCTDSADDGPAEGEEAEDEETGREEPDDDDSNSSESSTEEAENETEGDGDAGSAEIDPNEATFESADGSSVEGLLYGDGSCAVVMIPQIDLEKESWDDQARTLAENGHLAVPIDPGDRRTDAIEGVVGGLGDNRDVDRVVLIGASIGGEAALRTAAGDVEVDGVVAISPGEGSERSGELDAPLLLIVAEDDDDRFVSETERAYDEASEPKTMLRVEGSEHGQRLFDSQAGSDVTTAVSDFVDRTCGA